MAVVGLLAVVLDVLDATIWNPYMLPKPRPGEQRMARRVQSPIPLREIGGLHMDLLVWKTLCHGIEVPDS